MKNFQVPDRNPFELPATAKQKSYLWKLGFHDAEEIKQLGMDQASSLIDSALKSRNRNKAAWVAFSILGILLVAFLIEREETHNGTLPQPKNSPIAQYASDEIRKFDLTITQIVPGGEALARGAFYDIPPSRSIDPEAMGGVAGKWTPAGDFYISGLPKGHIDGEKLEAWLLRTGTKTFTTALGSLRTVPSYLLAPEPVATAHRPKDWKWQPGTRANPLEQPSRF